MKPTLKILLAFSIVSTILTISACKKTYDEGPDFSLRSKMNRITGKWRLVSMKGVERLNPEFEQYMILTKDEIYDGNYKASFINFQEETGCITYDSVGVELYTKDGYWRFFDEEFGVFCSVGEYLDKKEGLVLVIELKQNSFPGEKNYIGDRWKILKLTNNELKIVNNVCIMESCIFYDNNRTLTFEKE
ncbi:MAG: hypothetical protein GX378_09150 [Bacteroidales bacterium]|nr:hypothetical protein [Bacteroidales bacterium]